MSLETALVATDLSPAAGHAVRRAALLAGETGAQTMLAHVVPDTLPPEMHVEASAKAQAALALLAEELRKGGHAFGTRLLSGNVAEELAQAAADFDMAIVGARGEVGLLEAALGRTSTRLVRANSHPTLVVKREADEPYRRVVAAVDFSTPALAAAAWAIAIAPDARVHLVHAFEVEFEATLKRVGTDPRRIGEFREAAAMKAAEEMRAFASRLPIDAGQLAKTIAQGYAPRVIVDAAEKAGAELIVIGKHARGPVELAMVGSTTLQVLQMASCDVLVVPEPRGGG